MLIDDLKRQMLIAQKAQDIVKLETLRYLLAEIKNKEIELRPQKITLTDEHIMKVMSKLIKKGEEASVGFKVAGRMDLYDKEFAQVAVIKDLINTLCSFVVL